MDNIELINFIKLTLEQKKEVLSWRNNSNIREWMYNQNKITLDEHLKFIDSLADDVNKLYFYVKQDNEAIGIIDFTELNMKEIYFGLYANPYIKIAGIGRILEQISIDYAFNKLKVNKLKLEVFEDNIQVRNLHKKYKFKETGKKMINDKKVICMELTDENR